MNETKYLNLGKFKPCVLLSKWFAEIALFSFSLLRLQSHEEPLIQVLIFRSVGEDHLERRAEKKQKQKKSNNSDLKSKEKFIEKRSQS